MMQFLWSRRRDRRERRARGDRGVALVEAVFVFPVVLIVVFAIMEFGLLFAAESTTQSATRDGVRFGSANYAVSGSNQAAADAIAAIVAGDLGARTKQDTPLNLVVYKASSTGAAAGSITNGFTDCTTRCFKYTWNGSSWTAVSGSPGWSDPSACIDPTSGVNVLDSIGVYLEVRHNYITGAFGTSTVVKEHTVSRLEPLPLSQC